MNTTQTASPVELRQALASEVDYWNRCIPGTETSRRAARAIVAALTANPWMRDQLKFSTLGMVEREARGLSPVAP